MFQKFNIRNISNGVVLLLLSLGGVFSVAADDSNKSQTQPKTQKNKKTQIDFEDQLIQGEVKKPELFYLLQKKQFNFGKLLKMRENFLPEMTKTAEDIKKGR